MRLLLKLQLGLMFFVASLGIGGRWLVQHMATPRPVVHVLDAGDCPQPCWQNVAIGTTEYTAQLPTHALYESLYFDGRSGEVAWLDIRPLADVYIGDVMALWGQPSHVDLFWQVSHQGDLTRTVRLFFHEGLVVVDAIDTRIKQPPEGYISPYMRVIGISYYAPSPEGSVIPIGTARWAGFGARYPMDQR